MSGGDLAVFDDYLHHGIGGFFEGGPTIRHADAIYLEHNDRTQHTPMLIYPRGVARSTPVRSISIYSMMYTPHSFTFAVKLWELRRST